MANTSVFFVSWKGDDQGLNVTVLDDDGNAVDITLASEIDWIMKTDEYSTVDLINKSFTGGGITITNGPLGKFKVSLVGADISGLDAMTYYQSSRVTLGGSKTHVIVGTVWLRA